MVVLRQKQFMKMCIVLVLLLMAISIVYLITLPERDPKWLIIGKYIEFFSPSLYEGFKKRQQESRLQWFENVAQKTDIPLHAASGWGYMSEEEYNNMVYHVLNKMSIKDTDSVFELGCGVGAVLQLIKSAYGERVTIGGSDLSVQAIAKIQKVFPVDATNFFVASMEEKNEHIMDNAKDHVISFGALAMYLYKEGMLKALEEAIRIAKPGGHLCFTHFIEPNGKLKGSILEPIEKSFWPLIANQYSLENLIIEQMLYQKDRYFVCFSKKVSG